MTEHDEVRVSQTDAAASYPVIGESTEGLGEYLVAQGKLRDPEAFRAVRRDALEIIRRCRRFDEPDGVRTGLVVGYVQSGKTLSMTTVSALARDNGCRLIILLAGVTTNLLAQNAKRFKEHLRQSSGQATAWRIFNSQDGLGDKDRQHLRQAVAEWRDPAFSDDKQTFLYMVLKNHAHLERLANLLQSADLKGVPSLILDDEADQAGLNTNVGDTDGSTTYRKIAAVRSRLPHHTYLQYTATPQAPLLIALDDMLSPAFAELVEPGEGYTGGQAFFGVRARQGLIRTIPDADLFKPGQPPELPPESLVEAMRVFFVGCAVAATRGTPSLRSMLVHPSPRTSDHQRYMGWVSEIVRRWTAGLRSTDLDERRETLEEFESAHADLQRTDPDLPPLEELTKRLQVCLGRVSLSEVNSQDGSEVDWENANEHILVGGEKLNRGFTVEGLTVTYMPRDAGGWNADTLQQRARFFGYKAKYQALCRLYLHSEVIAAYRAYVRHEEDIRRQLAEHRGKPLREWRRAFFLNAKMRPTRANVLSDPYYRIPANRSWFVQRWPHEDEEAVQRNRERVKALEALCSFADDPSYFKHRVAELSLKSVYQDFLLAYEVRGSDVPGWYGQLVTLADVLESNAAAQIVIMQMHGDRERGITKERDVALHQGRSSSGKAGSYTGDASMRDATLVTLQIHWVDIKDGLKTVPGLAIHIPSDLRKDDVVASIPTS